MQRGDILTQSLTTGSNHIANGPPRLEQQASRPRRGVILGFRYGSDCSHDSYPRPATLSKKKKLSPPGGADAVSAARALLSDLNRNRTHGGRAGGRLCWVQINRAVNRGASEFSCRPEEVSSSSSLSSSPSHGAAGAQPGHLQAAGSAPPANPVQQ
jgi:hypothetical protein